MTWKSHLLANGALALAATDRPLVAVGAMLTAAVPDQMERWLPFAKHRGLSHWLLLWGAVFAFVHLATGAATPILGRALPWPGLERAVRDGLLGLALGPLLHVVMDGCSRYGVPLGPFIRWKFRLGLYRTEETRRRWAPLDVSEVIFLAAVLALCGVAWRLRG